MQRGVVLTESEYEEVVDKIVESFEDMHEIRRFDINAGTYSDRVNLRVDKVRHGLKKVLDILRGE